MRENKSKTEKLDKLKIDKYLTEKYLKLDSQFPRTEPFKNDEKWLLFNLKLLSIFFWPVRKIAW